MSRSIRIPALCALLPLLCAGFYGIVFGAQAALRYLSVTTIEVTAFSAFWALFLGVLRGVLAVLCFALCARAVWRGRIRGRDLVFPAILLCLYVLSLLDPPLTAAGILQACAAGLAFADMALSFLRSRV